MKYSKYSIYMYFIIISVFLLVGLSFSQTAIFSDNFDGSYPSSWYIGNDSGVTTSFWGRSKVPRHSGTQSIFCSDSLNATKRIRYYIDNLHTYIERRDVDLSGYADAHLSFWMYLYTQPAADYFSVSIRDSSGVWHEIYRSSGNRRVWTLINLNMAAYAGQAGLIVRFRFDSDGSIHNFQGVFVDDVLLTASVTPPPPVPMLSFPANGAGDVSLSPVLVWNLFAGALSYQLQVSQFPDFSTMVFDQSGLIDTSQAMSGLSGHTAYYWRVNASLAGGPGEWSDTWSFSTLNSPPVIQNSQDSVISINAGDVLDFSLNASDPDGDPLTYTHLDTLSHLALLDTVVDAGPGWTIIPQENGADRLDTVILIVSDSLDEVAYRLFLNVKSMPLENDKAGILPVPFIGANSPNPFNASARISYGTAKSAAVMIRIYDLKGAQVRILENSLKAPGCHEARWDGRDSRGGFVPAGLYFCSVKIGAMEKVMRLIRTK